MRSDVKRVLRFLVPLLGISACAPNAEWDGQEVESSADASIVGEVSQALVTQPVDQVIIPIIADTSVRASGPNKNFGTTSTLDINRGLLKPDTTALLNQTVQGDVAIAAKLRLTLVPSSTRRLQRNLGAHRMLKSWTEGGATWNCAVDSNLSNNTADCSGATKWSMTTTNDAFVATATGTTVIPASRTGVLEIDVTADVRAFTDDFNTPTANFGWLLKTGIGTGGEVADIASRETATPPQLIVSVRRCNAQICSPLPVCRSLGVCSGNGECTFVRQPFCDDFNPCTGLGVCAQTEPDVCNQGPALPAGTTCPGGTCDGSGQCIPSP